MAIWLWADTFGILKISQFVVIWLWKWVQNRGEIARKIYFASTTASKVVGQQDLVEVQEVIATSDEEHSSDSQQEESAGI